MSLTSGTRLGPYEIISSLAVGGMGQVYRGKDPRLGREIAIKVLPTEMGKDPEALVRFEREARALAALSHPNILVIFDVGTQSDISYVVMELLEGETLSVRIQRGAIQWNEAVEIAAEIAEGLAIAHSKGVIHRDLKPENVFLTSTGIVKILDFGLARFEGLMGPGNVSRAKTLSTTSPGMLIGTVQYMSPEQVRGLVADARSDLFAFGCVLYEMITGKRAFKGNTLPELLAAILRDPLPEIPDMEPKIPPALAQLIRACLQKDPEERIQTARELSTALRAISSGTAVWTPETKSVAKSGRRRRQAIDSLAILPFMNPENDPEVEYLCDAITEEMINKLSQLPQLRVMARATVFRYKGRSVDPQVVGRELNVRAVLTGSIFEREQNTITQVELVDVYDGARLWGGQFSSEMVGFEELQEQLSNQISEQLRLKLLQKEKKKLRKRSTENTEAYRLYLRGRFYWGKRTYDGFVKSIDYFEQSIQQDPSFALAYAGLADAYALLGGFGYLPPNEAYTKSKVEAIKALELDDSLAEAHTSLATVKYRFDWDWPAAEREFRKALEINPGYATAHHWFGVYLVLLERFDEGLAHAEKALELDPLSLVVNWTRGYLLYYVRRYDDAIEQYRKTLGIDPTFARVHIDIGLAHLQKKMYSKAIEEIQKGMTLMEDNPGLLAALAYAYGVAGDRQEATKILEELHVLSKRRYISPYAIATVTLGLGETEQTFDWLEKAFQAREDALVTFKVNPRWDPLRGDPRFSDLLRRVGLPV